MKLLENLMPRFEKLFQQIPSSHHPGKDYLLFLYIKYFLVQFQYLLKDKGPTTIQEAQEMAAKLRLIFHHAR
jgi:hypothetical protein